MKLQLSFEEINAFIKQEIKAVDIIVSQINEKTLCVNLSKFILKQNINLSIDKIDGNDIYLTIAGNAAIDSIIRGTVALLKESLPLWIEQVSDTSFILKLDKIDKAQKVLQYLALRDITMSYNGLDAIVDVR